MKITVFNDGVKVFSGSPVEFIRKNDHDADITRYVKTAVRKGNCRFTEFSGDWEIKREDIKQ